MAGPREPSRRMQHETREGRTPDIRRSRPRSRAPIDAAKVEASALSIAETGMQEPILVRVDKERHVLAGGLHDRGLQGPGGETTIIAHLVQARKH